MHRIVLLGTLAVAIAALGFVLRFSVNLPVVDEWDLVGVVLGGMTATEWAGTRLNEHLFLPANLAFYGLMTVSHCDFRAGMIANLLVLFAASRLATNAAAKIRGHAHVADLFIPVALLHWGHHYNLLMGFQLAFGLFALAATALLWVIATAEPGQEGRTAFRGGIVLLLLMLNGGMGVAFVPAVGLWVLALSWRAKRLLPVLFVLIAACYTAFVLFGMPKTAAAPPEPVPPGQLAWCVVQFLGVGLGPWVEQTYWPLWCGLAAAGVMMATLFAGIATLRRSDGGRAAGLFAVLLGHLAVALGIAASRGGGLAERYVTLSAVGFVAAYLAFVMGSRRRCVWLGFIAAVVLFAINLGPGERAGHQHRGLYRAFERDLVAGMPLPELAEKYRKPLRMNERLEANIRRLIENRVGPFAGRPTP